MPEIDIKSSTVDKLLDAAKGFLEKIGGPVASEIGLLFSDKVKLIRAKNQLKGLQKFQESVERKGFNPKQINLKVLFPYLEGIALEEDEDLQAMWANLMTNYVDPHKNLVVTVFPLILAQLSTEEIKVLKLCFRDPEDLKAIIAEQSSSEYFPVDPSAFANVERLGLISRSNLTGHGGGQLATPIDKIRRTQYQLSRFGQQFLEACEA